MLVVAAVITREFQLLNFAEAALWITIGVIAAALALRRGGATRLDLLILAICLIVFGLTDVMETRTGAWWSPPWLLALKGACVLVLLILLVRYARRRRRRRRSSRGGRGRHHLNPDTARR